MGDWLAKGLGLSAADIEAIERRVAFQERDFRAQSREEQAERLKHEEEFALDQSMVEKALAGVYGRQCRDLAELHVSEHGRSAKSLRSLRRTLAAVEGRVSG